MPKNSTEEVGIFKRALDKLMRKATGKFEDVKRIEIDHISAIYQLYFPELPEILKLGENYENRLELSIQSFRLEYWTAQLKGYFYTQVEQFINVMCSYEIAKMEELVSGYTDDPIHTLFHILKNWAVKLSNTHFDEEDIIEAKHWQSIIQDLITQQVFRASNIDSRVQVLFSLDEILDKEIIPRLIYSRENKSALEQLKTVSSHLEKFYYHVIKYLFYIARDSKYVPNFSHVKLLTLSGEPPYHKNYHLTELEKKAWGTLKDTLPIQLLVRLVKSDLTVFTQMPPLLISNVDSTKKRSALLKVNSFLNVTDEIQDENLRKYAKHIDFKTYVNTHVFMQELINFRQIFSAAQQCAEMGGNLLAFGLLRGQLTTDINDCLQCLQLIMNHCQQLENTAWHAYRDAAFSSKDKTLAYVSKDWQENYSQSAKNYYRQIVNEHEHCKTELSQLAAAANKKTTEFLIEETKQKIQTYLTLHEVHFSKREAILYGYANLNTSLTDNSRRMAYKPSDNPKQLYRNTKSLSFRSNTNVTDISKNLVTLAVQKPSVLSLYYAAKCLNDINTPPMKEPRQAFLTDLFKRPADELVRYRIKAHYLQAELFLEENNYLDAKENVDMGLDLATKIGDNKYSERLSKLNEKIMEAREALIP